MMNIWLSMINWFTAIPLGCAALFFGVLGFCRGMRFFDHESDASSWERLCDLFLSTVDMCAAGFALLLALSPIELWTGMIAIGLGMSIVLIPITILGNYYQLYVVNGFMLKNAGIRINAPIQYAIEALHWYELTPFAFIIGWLIFFLVKMAAFFVDHITGNTQGSSNLSTIIGISAGALVGLFITFFAYPRSKTR